jgi:hypothetical protein
MPLTPEQEGELVSIANEILNVIYIDYLHAQSAYVQEFIRVIFFNPVHNAGARFIKGPKNKFTISMIVEIFIS